MNNPDSTKLAPAVVGETYCFGPFILQPQQRRLQRGDGEVPLGGRAFDLLAVLVRSAGEVVSKKDLLRQVWPDVVVEEGSIRFHMVSVRKALGDGTAEGVRYIENVASRGYCFVAPVSRRQDAVFTAVPKVPWAVGTSSKPSIPALSTPSIGRDAAISETIAEVQRHRCVTLTGPGGIGKTTVAIEVAHRLSEQFSGDATFVDLGLLRDERLVASTIAGALNLAFDETVTAEQLSVILGRRGALLILDCCEHVIDCTARLVRDLVAGAPEIHVLVTSREPLRTDGEFVFRLPPLDYPPAVESVTVESARQSPAVRLFLERARAEGTRLELTEDSAPIISRLCRELDGIPLAIELAAGRVNAFGLRAITEQLDKQFKLMWHGRRTAVPRQQTLSATLDWSYTLLTPLEQTVLRRLAVFVGGASLPEATAVSRGADLEPSLVLESLAGLVDKSLVNVDVSRQGPRYILLDTTRGYALGKLSETSELDAVRRSHAESMCELFLTGGSITDLGRELGNARAALEWCFGADAGSVELGCMLTGAAAPVFLQGALLSECRKWSQQALEHLELHHQGTKLELDLQAAYAQSMMFTGGGDVARHAFERGLKVAVELGDQPGQMRHLSGLAMFQHRAADYRGALETARQAERIASQIGTSGARLMADSLLSAALHFVGDIEAADRHCRDVMRAVPALDRKAASANIGFDHRVRSMCGRARHLWMRGETLHASQMAEAAIAEAESLGHPASLCIALMWAGAVFLWAREYSRYGESIDLVSSLAMKHSLVPYQAVRDGLRGTLLAATGNYVDAEHDLSSSIDAMGEVGYKMLATVFAAALARAQIGQERLQDALDSIDQALAQVRINGDVVHVPELLVLRGQAANRLLGASEAESSFLEAMAVARDQGIKAWELRAAIEVARLWADTGRSGAASDLLRPLHAELKNADPLDLEQAAALIR